MTKIQKTLLQRLQAEARREHWQKAFLFDLRAERVRPPQVEYRFHADRKWRFDFAWPDVKVAVEIDGGTRVNGRHNRHEGFQEDLIKMNTAAAMGWMVYRFTSEQVKNGDAIKFMKGIIR